MAQASAAPRQVPRSAVDELIRTSSIQTLAVAMVAWPMDWDPSVPAFRCFCQRAARARHDRFLRTRGWPFPLGLYEPGQGPSAEILGPDSWRCLLCGKRDGTRWDLVEFVRHHVWARDALIALYMDGPASAA